MPVDQCPACRTSVKPGSYRCPKCKIYFCASCGRQVRKGDWEFYCRTSGCEYQNSLLCYSCQNTEERVLSEGGWFSELKTDYLYRCPSCHDILETRYPSSR